mmetsp:Transcript_94985/g.207768  ORF Transcript_94985/g.207768 Transcript_94985/m.207768 type:complete len:201 (-) Transcript_94985:161-763(-)
MERCPGMESPVLHHCPHRDINCFSVALSTLLRMLQFLLVSVELDAIQRILHHGGDFPIVMFKFFVRLVPLLDQFSNGLMFLKYSVTRCQNLVQSALGKVLRSHIEEVRSHLQNSQSRFVHASKVPCKVRISRLHQLLLRFVESLKTFLCIHHHFPNCVEQVALRFEERLEITCGYMHWSPPLGLASNTKHRHHEVDAIFD